LTKAVEILDEELVILDQDMKSLSVRLIISALPFHKLSKLGKKRACVTAMNMIGSVDEREEGSSWRFNQHLIKANVCSNYWELRTAAKNGDMTRLEVSLVVQNDKLGDLASG